ncbi:MAG: (2Fe-2S) ferredoxin domain-containing protein [Limnothrix sp.]
MSKIVRICCHQTCPKQGSGDVLQAFKAQAPSSVEVIASGCLGECGSGPMVLVLPENVWYAHVQAADVPQIVMQHLIGDRPVKRKLYRKHHPTNNKTIWLISIGLTVSLLGLLLGYLASLTTYI